MFITKKMTATDKKAVLLISWSSSWEFVMFHGFMNIQVRAREINI